MANGGVLVWEGAAGLTFSGRYLADELEDRGDEVTYAVGDFPSSLIGFDGVFLSFGTRASTFSITTTFPPASTKSGAGEATDRYLRAGGRLYLEGSDTLGYDIYAFFTEEASEILLPLFGIESAVDGDEEHEFAGLDENGALTEGMQFAETTQNPAGGIDIYTPGMVWPPSTSWASGWSRSSTREATISGHSVSHRSPISWTARPRKRNWWTRSSSFSASVLMSARR